MVSLLLKGQQEETKPPRLIPYWLRIIHGKSSLQALPYWANAPGRRDRERRGIWLDGNYTVTAELVIIYF